MPALRDAIAQLNDQVASVCSDLAALDTRLVEKEKEVQQQEHEQWVAQHHENVKGLKQWNEDWERDARLRAEEAKQQEALLLAHKLEQEKEAQHRELSLTVEKDLDR